MANVNDIIQWCEQTLAAREFKDYAPNGLQIEGKSEVNKILCAVSASQSAIEAAHRILLTSDLPSICKPFGA